MAPPSNRRDDFMDDGPVIGDALNISEEELAEGPRRAPAKSAPPKGVLIGVGALCAILLGGGAVMLLGGSDETSEPQPVQAALPNKVVKPKAPAGPTPEEKGKAAKAKAEAEAKAAKAKAEAEAKAQAAKLAAQKKARVKAARAKAAKRRRRRKRSPDLDKSLDSAMNKLLEKPKE